MQSIAGVLDNDVDPNADPLAAVLVTGPSNGTLTFSSNGSFSYTPNPNFNGPDSFSYRASDGPAISNVATVTINVTPVNDASIATDDAFVTLEDTPLTVPAPGVLANDVDLDSPSLTAVLVTGPARGTLVLNPNGSFVYTPNIDFSGPDSFVYRATDGSTLSNTATVSITVTPSP